MLRLLASLFSLIDRLLSAYRDSKLEEQGRQKVKEELDANVAKAKDTLATPDPERDERLRNRFDRSRQCEDYK
jgi:hypothetical protein